MRTTLGLVLLATVAGVTAGCQKSGSPPTVTIAATPAVACESVVPIRERQCTGSWLDVERNNTRYTFNVSLKEQCPGVWDFEYMPPSHRDNPSSARLLIEDGDGIIRYKVSQGADGRADILIRDVSRSNPNLSYRFNPGGFGQNSDLSCTDLVAQADAGE